LRIRDRHQLTLRAVQHILGKDAHAAGDQPLSQRFY
jgi:hypothetical protein